MKNEIYIANGVAKQIRELPSEQQQKVTKAIDLLNGEGWKNSQIVVQDESEGGGLRSVISDNIRVLFRYAAKEHAIIVADVASIVEHRLAAIA